VASARFLKVLVDLPLEAPLEYSADGRGEQPLDADVGLRCLVPLGRRRVVGLVVGSSATSELAGERLKPVERLLDEVPALDAHWFALTRFAADYYQHPWGEVALTALPPALRQVPGPRYIKVLERLRKTPLQDASSDVAWRPDLSSDQTACVASLTAGEGFVATLLHGVTGSGKTEVYLSAIERRLAAGPGAQVLLLVPEINLTPQLEAQVRARLPGYSVVSLHSGLSAGERAAAWLAGHEGRARLIVGTRLAVFASLPKLTMIVIDEEHDPSYKAGEGVRYSARDLAVKRAQLLDIPVVLGSATPSLESWSHARSGRYRLLTLRERVIGVTQPPPAIELVDPGRTTPENGIAPPIVEALDATLSHGEQSLVFLNRRGYAPVVACDACGWLSNCPHCTAYAVYHKADRTLRCHHCGWSSVVPRRCPTCGNAALHAVGRGTQRIEESLRQLLPSARILRVDRDSTRRRDAAAEAFDAVHRGEVDVLVGTQMIAKGHDFRNVALVAVLNADSQLASHDFRASERLFATLTQVIGRAGRSGRPSRALVQTRFPRHPLFAALCRHDYSAFADGLLSERVRAGMPPASHQALLMAEARRIDLVLAWLRDAVESARPPEGVRLYDPVPMALARRAGVERAQLLVESQHRARLQSFLREWLNGLRAVKGSVRWQIEVDPAEI
jgi:primosomal protein N' (replication factor Y) (superfamily II helicase)